MPRESSMPLDAAPRVIEIRTAFPSREDAERCGRDLLDRRLAACVQVDGPVTSLYRWQGRIESAAEFRCTCKTSGERADDCVAAIRGMHPYELPEILRTACAASAEYARWVVESVAP
jgi:periplasmic divalent cation tolerance protein